MKDFFNENNCLTKIYEIQSLDVFNKKKSFNNAPQITIAIPTFSRTRTLSETISSAINQIGFEDYEILVVDNNPDRDDETELLMMQYKNNPRIFYYKNEVNVGMAGNWNKCLLLAHSNNVVLLHDDDIISPYCINSINKIFDKLDKKWALIKCQTHNFNSTDKVSFIKPNKLSLIKFHACSYIETDPVGAPTNILINRDVILGIGGYNGEYYPSFDYAMSAKLMLAGYSNYRLFASSPLGGYRIEINESMSSKTMDKYFVMRYSISEEVCKKLNIPYVVGKLIRSFNNKTSVYSNSKEYQIESYHFRKEDFDLFDTPLLLDKYLLILQRIYLKIKNKKIDIIS